VRRTSELFYRFKTGEKSLAFPLALGMDGTLRKRKAIDFDCLVPIPLSPDKARANEIHRTRLLAAELSDLMGIETVDCLSLSRPVSKRRLLALSQTRAGFRDKYYDALSVDTKVTGSKRLLLIDDVATEGTTLGCAFRRIRKFHPNAEVSAATAGQMIVKAVVKDERAVRS
jgi:predicted amidophosphoribosyltransferase